MKRYTLTKSASIISRGTNRFFDHELSSYGIGCGQQFFLSQIAEHEGITMYGLAKLGRFDKTTVTRAIQKLVEMNYVICETDERDHRIRHLYTTETAAPLLNSLRGFREAWEEVLTKNMTPEEIHMVSILMDKIAQNAYRYQKEDEIRHESHK